ncbi:M15 family metallopeptidase domain-containing protein [Streptoalloteichus hindustanus]|uniref:D-alanyl-D-alanine carboxypeptidase n=1 Tax=Streptoalloteichus hindustanus TaxID=2017 RepID=A0A1M4U2C3_STRHI|nr:M15 family metallopeptidase [Streptoalloteichus hindustanus]SHE50858.1 hypothetical protein SAMN05444320_101273 [Streptoalloteichus hindustanus]
MRRFLRLLTSACLTAVVVGTIGAAALLVPQPPSGRTDALVVHELVPVSHGGRCGSDPAHRDVGARGLEPRAADAWARVVKAARKAGVHPCVHSGKRGQRKHLADRDRRVARPKPTAANSARGSAHRRGLAVDVWPASAASWLASTKGEFGWCQRQPDAPWHFEYDPRWATGGCPAPGAARHPTHQPNPAREPGAPGSDQATAGVTPVPACRGRSVPEPRP